MYSCYEETIKILKRELGIYNTLLFSHLDLKNDLGIGSLEKARMIYALDQRFKINSNSDISSIQTIGDCVSYVNTEMEKKRINAI